HFSDAFSGDRFARLRERGAHVQRPLWASTSTKNPAYRDVVYVENLIGPHTVNTMPLATVQAFADHGEARRTVDAELGAAREDLQALSDLGIDLGHVTHQLQVQGVEKFVDPFRELLRCIGEKLEKLAARG